MSTTKGDKLLSDILLNYENLITLLKAYADASNSDQVVKLRKYDGTEESVSIKSYGNLLKDLNNIQSQFNSLINSETYRLQSNGEIVTYKRTSLLNIDHLKVFQLGAECVVNPNKDIIENFVFPLVQLPIELDKIIESQNSVQANCYIIENGFELIPDNVSFLELNNLIKTGKVTAKDFTRTLQVKKKPIGLYGTFDIINVTNTGEAQTYNVELNTLLYGSTLSLENNIQLKTGDKLVTPDGSSEFEIVFVDVLNKVVRLHLGEYYNGFNALKPGVNALEFKQKFDESSDSSIIYLPIKPKQKLVTFFQLSNARFEGYPSVGVKIDTSDFTVIHNSKKYTIDEYFENYVSDFSSYLSGLISETTIPFSLGIRPDKPVLENANFQVVQINKHLIDSKTKTEIESLNKQKQAIKNQIEYKQLQIQQYEQELNSLKYNSIEEKNYRIQTIKNIREEINVLEQNVLTTSRSIDNQVSETGITNQSPKYKIIGFWHIQPPIFNTLTPPQHIVKYEVQYRYLSRGIDVADTPTYKMIDNGKEVLVTYSNWNTYQSSSLTKIIDETTKQPKWEQQRLDSIDNININQCAISINENESVEIRIRAVSEAGYPITPLMSEWSNIIRIDFPDSLKDSNLQSTITRNTRDLSLAEFTNILYQQGILSHLAGTIRDGDRVFHHAAKDIASGQYTPEQKNIPLDVVIRTLIDEINRLKSKNDQSSVVVSFVDFDNESYLIQPNSTLEIFAGNYTDTIDIVKSEQYGSIITKRGYIKLQNTSNIPVEIQSLFKNQNAFQTNGLKYVGYPVIIGDSVKQKAKQILYFRNQELFSFNESELLVRPYNATKTVPTIQINNVKASASETEQTYLGLDAQNNIVAYALIDSSIPINSIALHKSILNNTTNEFKEKLKAEFKRLQVYGPYLREEKIQTKIDDTVLSLLEGTSTKIGFNHIVDPYAIGEHTLGAWLYPQILKDSSIQTNGDGYNASFVIEGNSEVLVPIIFEYRMTDKLGQTYAQNPNDLTYTKKLGIDLIINNKEFNFDLQITAKLKSKISSLKSKSISTISGAFVGEKKEVLQ